jgi:hypothetical protein
LIQTISQRVSVPGKAVLAGAAVEVGSKIGMAWTDDGIALVEDAERQGFKARSVFFRRLS